jgi:hypothetical protein
VSIVITVRQGIPIQIDQSSQSLAPTQVSRPVTIQPEINQVLVNPTINALEVSNAPRPVTLSNLGQQGPIGPAGPGADGTVPPLSFSYGDAPGVIWTPSEAGTLTYVRAVFETAFNGTNPSFILGTLADADAILAADQADPNSVGEYEVTADVHLAASEAVYISINPGAGASQGAGLIYLTFIPD